MSASIPNPYREQAQSYAQQARRHGYSAEVLSWSAALDNYEPPRMAAYGYAVRYAGTLIRADGSRAEYPTAGITMFCHDDQLPLGKLISAGPHAVALFDSGDSVQPYYCAGWNPYQTDKQRDPELHWGSGAYVLWHAFPTAQPGEMTKGTPSYPLDYGNWALGPRRAYHFKATVIPDDKPCGYNCEPPKYTAINCRQHSA